MVEGWDVEMNEQLVGPPTWTVEELPASKTHRRWRVGVPPREGGEATSLTLTGERLWPTSRDWTVPEVRIEQESGPVRLDETLILPERGFSVRSQRGLQALDGRGTTYRLLPDAKVTLAIRPTRAEGLPTVLLLRNETQAAQVAGRWYYRARLEFGRDAEVPLRVRWPAQAVPIAMIRDGIEVPLSLPVEWAGGDESSIHELLGLWTYDVNPSIFRRESLHLEGDGRYVEGSSRWMNLPSVDEMEFPWKADLQHLQADLRGLDWLIQGGAVSPQNLGNLLARTEPLWRRLDTYRLPTAQQDMLQKLRTEWNAFRERIPATWPPRAAEPTMRGWNPLPMGQLFREAEPLQPRLESARRESFWTLVPLFFALFVLIAFTAFATRPEQLVLIGALGTLLFPGWGGRAFLLLVAFGLIWRVVQFARLILGMLGRKIA